MAKKTRRRKTGPYLVAVLFCDQCLEDKHDGAVSLIRVIDRQEIVLAPSTSPNFPSESNRVSAEFVTFVAFKTGGSPGPHTVQCVMESPSGKEQRVFEQTVVFPDDPSGGASFTLRTKVGVYKGGLFWLHVFLDGRRAGRAPIQILLRRLKPEKPEPGRE
jgi:hypothetical protein